MALITCPECGKVFSDRAAHCPQCGLPTSEALKDIAAGNGGAPVPPLSAETGQSAANPQPAAPPAPPKEIYTRQDYDRLNPKPPKNGRRGSLTVYILIVAVVVLAIACIVMIVNSGGGSQNDYADPNDSLGTVTTLPADTQPQQISAPQDPQPLSTPVIEEDEGEATEENAEEPAAQEPAQTSEPAQPASNPASAGQSAHSPAQSAPAQNGQHPAQQ